MTDKPLRFKRVKPRPYETRRYVTDTSYGDRSYVITRGRIGGWGLWIIENNPDVPPGEPGRRGWRGFGYYKTMSAARIAAEQHRSGSGIWNTAVPLT